MFKSKKKNGDEPEWDPVFEPLMKVLQSKKGIKTKSASEVGRKKVDYFRGKDFKKFVLEHADLLSAKCKAALEQVLGGETPTTEKDVEKLGAELVARGFCYKAMYKPLNPSAKAEDGSEKKTKKSWPDRLGRTPNQCFDCEHFYVIEYSSGAGMQYLLLALMIAGVLVAVMFPVWPFWAKVGIWYLSVIFLSIYFGLLIWRMVIYTLFWIVGFDFWIFPNINDEYCGFLDSFQPLYSWDKRKDDPFMLLVRFAGLAIVAVAVQQIAETHSLSDVQDFVTSAYIDVIDWGVDKLTYLPGSEKQMLPSVETLEKELNESNNSNVTTAADIDADEDDAPEPAPAGKAEDTVEVD